MTRLADVLGRTFLLGRASFRIPEQHIEKRPDFSRFEDLAGANIVGHPSNAEANRWVSRAGPPSRAGPSRAGPGRLG